MCLVHVHPKRILDPSGPNGQVPSLTPVCQLEVWKKALKIHQISNFGDLFPEEVETKKHHVFDLDARSTITYVGQVILTLDDPQCRHLRDSTPLSCRNSQAWPKVTTNSPHFSCRCPASRPDGGRVLCPRDGRRADLTPATPVHRELRKADTVPSSPTFRDLRRVDTTPTSPLSRSWAGRALAESLPPFSDEHLSDKSAPRIGLIGQKAGKFRIPVVTEVRS